MNRAMSEQALHHENVLFHGTGGVSAQNKDLRFRPAFMDLATGLVYASRFADGSPAPFHILDGLPGEVVISRDACGRAIRATASLISGFVRDARFYTRDEAAALVAANH